MKAEEAIDQGARALKKAARRFSWAGLERDQAMELLSHALGRTPDDDEEVNGSRLKRYESFIERRASGEPMPYILGYTEFLGMRLGVRKGGFVPRETTEHLARTAISRLKSRREPVGVDVATGIGPIALAMAHAVPKARVFGVDISAEALAQARANAKRLNLSNATFLKSDMLSALPKELLKGVDVITSHPPYVAKQQVRELPIELREFEPVVSLTDNSSDGLGFAGELADRSREWLRSGGWLMMEVGSYLARDLRRVFVQAGYRDVRSTYGEWKLTRVIAGRL